MDAHSPKKVAAPDHPEAASDRMREPSKVTAASDDALSLARGEEPRSIVLTVYAAPNRTRPIGVEHLADEHAIDAWISNPPVGPKERLPYVAPHEIREGGTRRGADIERVARLLWLDVDGAWGPTVRAKLHGLWWRAFPSPSGKPGRARVLVLCTRTMSLPEARAVLLYLDTRVGGVCDRACLHAVQGYWMGHEPGVEWWVDGEDGTPLDIDALDLRDTRERVLPAPTSEDLAMWPASWRAARAREIVDRWGDAEEGGRHAALFRAAQVCRDWAVGDDLLREIVCEWNAKHCKPPREDEHIDRSILANIDRYRRHPVGCALPACVRIGHEHGPCLGRVEKILAASEDRLFVRGEQLVSIDDDEAMRAVGEKRLSEIVSNRVHFMCWDSGTKKRDAGWKRCAAPPWVVAELLARKHWPRLRVLTDVVYVPTLRRDGTILTDPGYDADTGLYLMTDVAVEIPEAPTCEEGKAALESVAAIFSQFPFASDAHRSVHLAYLLTSVALGYIDGPIPLVLFDANRRQTGKSKLAKSISAVLTGKKDPAVMQWYSDPARMTRQVFSAAGRSLLYYDNIKTGSILEGLGVMDSLITERNVSMETMYEHAMQDRPARPVIVVTGNAIQIGSDLEPRTLLCRLRTDLEHPEQRGDLKIPDLLQHVLDRRGEIITALLTAWRAWLAAGAPSMGLAYWHTFESWMAVRDLLVWLGRPDPCGVRAELKRRDAGEEALSVVLAWAVEEGKDFLASELLAAAKSRVFGGAATTDTAEAEKRALLCQALCHVAGCTADKLDAAAVGRALKQWVDRRGSFEIVDPDDPEGKAVIKGSAVLRQKNITRKSESGRRTGRVGWTVEARFGEADAE